MGSYPRSFFPTVSSMTQPLFIVLKTEIYEQGLIGIFLIICNLQPVKPKTTKFKDVIQNYVSSESSCMLQASMGDFERAKFDFANTTNLITIKFDPDKLWFRRYCDDAL